jgi:DNA-directed RNA polymerase specialized sigma subunit
MNIEDAIVNECRKSLRRFAWRLQYRVRVTKNKELISTKMDVGVSASFTSELVSDLYIQELLNQIPNEKGKEVIRKVVIEGMTEREVAEELNMTQQAVSKCKIKAIELLRKAVGHSPR